MVERARVQLELDFAAATLNEAQLKAQARRLGATLNKGISEGISKTLLNDIVLKLKNLHIELMKTRNSLSSLGRELKGQVGDQTRDQKALNAEYVKRVRLAQQLEQFEARVTAAIRRRIAASRGAEFGPPRPSAMDKAMAGLGGDARLTDFAQRSGMTAAQISAFSATLNQGREHEALMNMARSAGLTRVQIDALAQSMGIARNNSATMNMQFMQGMFALEDFLIVLSTGNFTLRAFAMGIASATNNITMMLIALGPAYAAYAWIPTAVATVAMLANVWFRVKEGTKEATKAEEEHQKMLEDHIGLINEMKNKYAELTGEQEKRRRAEEDAKYATAIQAEVARRQTLVGELPQLEANLKEAQRLRQVNRRSGPADIRQYDEDVRVAREALEAKRAEIIATQQREQDIRSGLSDIQAGRARADYSKEQAKATDRIRTRFQESLRSRNDFMREAAKEMAAKGMGTSEIQRRLWAGMPSDVRGIAGSDLTVAGEAQTAVRQMAQEAVDDREAARRKAAFSLWQRPGETIINWLEDSGKRRRTSPNINAADAFARQQREIGEANRQKALQNLEDVNAMPKGSFNVFNLLGALVQQGNRRVPVVRQ